MEENTQAQKPASRMIVYGMAAVITGLAVCTGLLWQKVSKLEVAGPPALVVVDFMQLAQQYPKDASEQEINRQMALVGDALKKLGDAGYVVLDSKDVVSAPASAYLYDLYDLALEAQE